MIKKALSLTLCLTLVIGCFINSSYANDLQDSQDTPLATDQSAELFTDRVFQNLDEYLTAASEAGSSEYELVSIDSTGKVRLIHYTEEELSTSIESPSSEDISSHFASDFNSSPRITYDNRVRVTNTSSFPYCTTFILNASYSDGASITGTGFYVAKNIILTAAHVGAAYSHGTMPELTVTFADGTSIKPKVLNTVTHKAWTGNGVDSSTDYAIILLDGNYSDVYLGTRIYSKNTRACLIIGEMTNGRSFFRQTKTI